MIADLLAGPIAERLQVVDLSVGGLKLLITEGLNGYKSGDLVLFRLESPRSDVVELEGEIRYIARALGVCGIQFRNPTEAGQRALQKVVADLMERGSLA